MELAELKTYLRIDHDLDDELLKMLVSTAEKFILGSIEVEKTDDERFNYAVTLLVSNWYENRVGTSTQALNEIPFGVTALIQQLRGLEHGTNQDE
ncbi:head-tail connector protein [Enterococcus faecalis]|uniref:head-tail connector protein n=2 Tax=Enterococcus TaxID=1350 RepID=UPI002090F562|nr:head-tail connector protein [Enterococcus faecalis]MCO5486518.1 head-tail connector protein [Enterococcus faecalis]